jgi:ATP-binding cassette, subfamily B, bacterial PglK
MEPDEARTFHQSSKLPKSFSKLRLENIKFRYGDNLPFILSHINLELSKGKKYALIGQTGIGKTTLGDIIAGLIAPTSGKLLVDDNQVCLVGNKAWYSNLGYLPQHISLMDDTLKKNIVLKDHLSDEEENWLKSVLEIFSVDEFINYHPKGINTYVGEKGNKYSGGQLQRIGLARAIFKKPSFLILDESTSALDPFIEKELLSRLKKALPDITLFHISHKENIIKDCDLIFLLCKDKTLIQDTYSNFLNKSFEFQNLMNKKI